MEHFPAAEETEPHGPVDLTDQSTVFLMLEELAIAHLQSEWLGINSPGSDDEKDAAQQAQEFLADICDIFSGSCGPDRLLDNGWAGAKMAQRVRGLALPMIARLGVPTETSMTDRELLEQALKAFLRSLSTFSAQQEAVVKTGGKPDPSAYIQFMAAWSGLFSGAADGFELDEKLIPPKA